MAGKRMLAGAALAGAISVAVAWAAPPNLTPDNAVTQWHANAQTLVSSFTGRGNAAQAYTSSLIQIAVYDAVVAIRGGYEPFLAHIYAPDGADVSAAVATAAYRVGWERVNNNPTARTNYTNQYNAYLATIPDSQAKIDGVAVGEAAAQTVLAARASDNFYNTAVYANPPADPGVWQATAVADQYATAGANDYPMAFTIPLTADSPGARRPPAPKSLDSKKYARSLAEIQALGRKDNGARTAEQNDTVQFWTESGFTLWQRNTRDIVIGRGLDELEAARALAMLGVAGGDGMLACFEAKYHYMLWRPFQAIQRADEDGNRHTEPEAGWTPAVRANHPEYPAGHGCYGAAMATALKKVFHEDFSFSLSSTGAQLTGWPVVPSRSYQSLDDVIVDNGNARVWGGLHYRTTMDASAKWMKRLVREALKGRFKKIGDDCDDDDCDDDCDDQR